MPGAGLTFSSPASLAGVALSELDFEFAARLLLVAARLVQPIKLMVAMRQNMTQKNLRAGIFDLDFGKTFPDVIFVYLCRRLAGGYLKPGRCYDPRNDTKRLRVAEGDRGRVRWSRH